MIDALATEWLKLRTLRSTSVVLGVVAAVVGLMTLLAWWSARTWDRLPPGQRDHLFVSPLPEVTHMLASLCLAVLGVLAFSGEYGTGMIRTTFTVLPSRGRVLAAKAGVVGVVAVCTGLAAVLATYAAGRLLIGDRPIRGQSAEALSGQLPHFLAMSLSIAMFALLGLCLAAITRSAVAAVAILVAVWYVLPIVGHNLPAPWDERVGSILPGALAGQLAGTGNPYSVAGALLSPPAALAVMVAYVAVPYAVAAVLLARRDA
ncbi:ABC transporter permease [Microbispora rosea subsp. aerata]|nr:ABC transporter permease [Microbispora rosea]GGO29616.1 ABC transporter permease [Microbispora rosea subsp. aerata]GIH57668.1 ABC transporter permease [Microbispora rosea subsp. aerata]GLJ85848.1 ABC transporter permease [Microbispora rosea subsp. aerata]